MGCGRTALHKFHFWPSIARGKWNHLMLFLLSSVRCEQKLCFTHFPNNLNASA
uniref:Uncharacterized protein n=1 Tax=Arundo donax TaxID=35708 RepID=A0A0A9CS99_ARUDO